MFFYILAIGLWALGIIAFLITYHEATGKREYVLAALWPFEAALILGEITAKHIAKSMADAGQRADGEGE